MHKQFYLAERYDKEDRFNEAQDMYLKSIQTANELLSIDNSAVCFSDIALAMNKLGLSYSKTLHTNKAKEMYIKSIQTYETIAKNNPEGYYSRMDLCLLYYYALQFKEAKKECSHLVEIYSKLYKEYKYEHSIKRRYLKSVGLLANIHKAMGDYAGYTKYWSEIK